jgi:hypothetical protein
MFKIQRSVVAVVVVVVDDDDDVVVVDVVINVSIKGLEISGKVS